MNGQNIQKAVEVFLEDDWDRLSVEIPNSMGRAIDGEFARELTEGLMALISGTIASLIDAGSEREAVEENEDLYQAVLDEVNSWTFG